MVQELFRQLLAMRIVRFGLVGGIATLIHIAAAFIYLYFLGDQVFVANLTGFSCAFGFSYLMQTRFVFSSRVRLDNASKFFIIQFAALLISQMISELDAEANSYYRVLFVAILLPLVTFFIHRGWTFARSEP